MKRVKMIEGQRALFDVTGRHDEGDQLPSYESSHDWMELQHFLIRDTLQGTNISPKNGILKMIFLFPRWDMLIPWRVHLHSWLFFPGSQSHVNFFGSVMEPGFEGESMCDG